VAARRARGRGRERRQPVELALERLIARVLQAGEDEPPAQRLVGGQPLQRVRRPGDVAGLDEQPARAVGERGRDAADARRDDRQAGGVRLDEHLRQPLGAREVQERVARAVALPQRRAARHLAEHPDGVAQAAPRDRSASSTSRSASGSFSGSRRPTARSSTSPSQERAGASRGPTISRAGTSDTPSSSTGAPPA
jgi:hypothetical protein